VSELNAALQDVQLFQLLVCLVILFTIVALDKLTGNVSERIVHMSQEVYQVRDQRIAASKLLSMLIGWEVIAHGNGVIGASDAVFDCLSNFVKPSDLRHVAAEAKSQLCNDLGQG